MEQKKVPNPGSPEAIKLNCSCPILDNRHGQGAGRDGEFWINEGCPLHDKKEAQQEKIRVYIIHEYGRRHGLSEKECEENVLHFLLITRELIRRGHNPVNPLLWHFVHRDWNHSPDEEVYYELVSTWLRFCDVALVGKASRFANSGVDREIRMARTMGIPVYNSLEELPDAI